MPELIIFDCDGVLVDSEPIANKILVEVLNEIGLPLTFQESLKLFLGKSWKDSLKIIEGRLGSIPKANLTHTYMDRMFSEFDKSLTPIPGIKNALDSMHHKTCVASSGPHKKIRKTLGLTGLLQRFEGRIFSATDVENGKPAPDIFLLASKTMAVSPEKCLVVEDSLNGIRAAIAAKMKAIHYIPKNSFYNETINHKNVTQITNMADLEKTISEIN
jgi:HAD superfamily hydrolase (TIGR01509 family)|tara:strand:- start:5 stop:652 length:648 start_codon:yes stop_codon:yes gene_type:complete